MVMIDYTIIGFVMHLRISCFTGPTKFRELQEIKLLKKTNLSCVFPIPSHKILLGILSSCFRLIFNPLYDTYVDLKHEESVRNAFLSG